MDAKRKIRQGMQIVGADDRYLGTVERVDDEYVYVGGRRIPAGAFDRVERDRLHVGEGGHHYFETAETAGRPEGPVGGAGTQVRIPIAEERLVPGVREVQTGEVLVHKRVEEIEEVFREQVTRTDVEVQRVKTNRRVDGPVEPHQDGEWLVIPVVEEVLVIEKIPTVVEEIRIRRRPITEEQEIRETRRREHAEVEDATDRGGRQRTAGPGRQGRAGAAETASAGPGHGEAWEHLREEIREASRGAGEVTEQR